MTVTFNDLVRGGDTRQIQMGWQAIKDLFPQDEFMANRRGFGAGVTAGCDDSYQTLWVTSNADTGPGTLRAAVAVTGKTHIKFAILDSIVDVNKTGLTLNDDTLLDGTGWPGAYYGGIYTTNARNALTMFVSALQPFKYGGNPSGGCFGAVNSVDTYLYRCTAFDSGDVLQAAGAYYTGKVRRPGPYSVTMDGMRLGPNPGEYAMMAPIQGNHPGCAPGALNDINNDPRNGKCMECAFDHNSVDAGQVALADVSHAYHATMVGNVLQGCLIRNGKARSQYVDFTGNLVAKFGNPAGGGNGSVISDDGVLNAEGSVYLPYNAGEQFLGFTDAVADRNGKARIHITTPCVHVLDYEGTAKQNGNARFGMNWLPVGAVVDQAAYIAGFARPYALPVADVSTDAAAAALIHQLEDDPATRAGNPFSTVQPPSWRAVHNRPPVPRHMTTPQKHLTRRYAYAVALGDLSAAIAGLVLAPSHFSGVTYRPAKRLLAFLPGDPSRWWCWLLFIMAITALTAVHDNRNQAVRNTFAALSWFWFFWSGIFVAAWVSPTSGPWGPSLAIIAVIGNSRPVLAPKLLD